MTFQNDSSAKGKRLKKNYAKVQEGSNGQLIVTIPRRLAQDKRMIKGTVIKFDDFFTDSIIMKVMEGQKESIQ